MNFHFRWMFNTLKLVSRWLWFSSGYELIINRRMKTYCIVTVCFSAAFENVFRSLPVFIEQQVIEHGNTYTVLDAYKIHFHMKSIDRWCQISNQNLHMWRDTDSSLLLPPDPQHLPEPPLDGEIFFCWGKRLYSSSSLSPSTHHSHSDAQRNVLL